MGKGDSPDYLYLPGPRHGLFNRQAAKSHKEIILTESIIDALTLINAGIRNAIPCYGTNGLTQDHIRLFKQYRVETISISFDGDVSGKEATEAVSAKGGIGRNRVGNRESRESRARESRESRGNRRESGGNRGGNRRESGRSFKIKLFIFPVKVTSFCD